MYHIIRAQVPDELTKSLLSRSGASCSDDRTVRLVSLAAQKFLTDIVDEAKIAQSSRSQASLAVQKAEGYVRPQDKEKDRRATLLTEDLTKALQQVGDIPFKALTIPSTHLFLTFSSILFAVWVESTTDAISSRPTKII